MKFLDKAPIVDGLFDIGMEHDVIFSPLFAHPRNGRVGYSNFKKLKK